MTTIANAAPAVQDSATLDASKRFCQQLTRSAAKNFYYGLRLLPEPKRSAMFTLYAYMRLVDDIADREDGGSPSQRSDALERWRDRTHAVFAGRQTESGNGADAVWPAFAELVERYHLPVKLFDAAIAGQQQDLDPTSFKTFDELHEYCYRVAGVVGLASLHIWGYEGGEESEAMAIALGVAFQLTNILRDLREDSARGRVYLPSEDLRAAGVSEADLRAGAGGDAFGRLMRIEIDRAQAQYDLARGLELRISPECRPTLVAMTEIYHRLLAKVSIAPEQVLRRRVSLSTWSKLRIGWRAARAYRAASAGER